MKSINYVYQVVSLDDLYEGFLKVIRGKKSNLHLRIKDWTIFFPIAINRAEEGHCYN